MVLRFLLSVKKPRVWPRGFVLVCLKCSKLRVIDRHRGCFLVSIICGVMGLDKIFGWAGCGKADKTPRGPTDWSPLVKNCDWLSSVFPPDQMSKHSDKAEDSEKTPVHFSSPHKRVEREIRVKRLSLLLATPGRAFGSSVSTCGYSRRSEMSKYLSSTRCGGASEQSSEIVRFAQNDAFRRVC